MTLGMKLTSVIVAILALILVVIILKQGKWPL